MQAKSLIIFLCAVGAFVNTAGAQEVDRDNVVVLLDGSGSMQRPMPGDAAGRTKMDAAKDAVLAALAEVPAASTNVGLLVFGQRSGWVYDLAPPDLTALRRDVAGIRAAGATPLGEYLKIAADRLLQQRETQRGYGTYRLLVLTDGEANDPGLVDRYLPDLLRRGITLDVIGVAMAQDSSLAARANSYRRADDAAALEKSLQDVLGEVGGAAADPNAAAADFAVIAPLPQQTAAAMLTALATTGNQPLGEGPAASAIAPATPAIAPAAVPAGAAPTPAPNAPRVAAGGPGSRGGGLGPFEMMCGLAGLVLVIIIAALVLRGGKPSRDGRVGP